MALSNDRDTQVKEGWIWPHAMIASTTIFKGALVIVVTASGNCENGTDKASCTFGGIADEKKTNGATAGATEIKLRKTGVWLLPAQSAIAQTDIGGIFCVYDSEKVERIATTTNDIIVGRCEGVYSTTHVWVKINGYC